MSAAIDLRKIPLGNFDPVASIVHDQRLKTGLVESLLASAAQIFQQDGPTYWSQYVGWNMYLLSPHHAAGRLREWGFETRSEGGQCRLYAKDAFFCPVDISFHNGTVSKDGIARFKWKRGPVTRQSVRINEVNYPELQPSLLGSSLPTFEKPKEIHLHVLYYMSPKRLQAWLVLGTKWRDQQTLECPQWNEICCREDLDFISIPDILPSNNDSDYPIEFGEL